MKRNTIVFVILTLIILPAVSASLVGDTWDKITGKATSQPVELAINVTGGNAPTIEVLNETITDVSAGLSEAPLQTFVDVGVLVTDLEGEGNINQNTLSVIYTKSGEESRTANCNVDRSGGGPYSILFTCRAEMWWWDSPGVWTIEADISDLNDNPATNHSMTFTVGATTGFTVAPTFIAWDEINPGATLVPARDFMTLNNTGNLQRNIQMNSTNLRGLTDNTKAIFADDFSLNTVNACGGTAMNYLQFTQINGAILPRGNYTKSDGSAQEDLYFCIEVAGQDLTAQSYSTQQEGPWTLKISA